MTLVLVLLVTNAVLGGWDTLYYHEYRDRLTSKLAYTRPESRLHVARDAVYVGLYGVLAWGEPTGLLVAVVVAALLAEIGITLADFVIEDRDRPAIGGMTPGERILHSLMAIVYGAMLAFLVPQLMENWGEPTGITGNGVPTTLSWIATLAAVGIAVSGTRDGLALRGIDPIWTPQSPSPTQSRSRLPTSG